MIAFKECTYWYNAERKQESAKYLSLKITLLFLVMKDFELYLLLHSQTFSYYSGNMTVEIYSNTFQNTLVRWDLTSSEQHVLQKPFLKANRKKIKSCFKLTFQGRVGMKPFKYISKGHVQRRNVQLTAMCSYKVRICPHFTHGWFVYHKHIFEGDLEATIHSF